MQVGGPRASTPGLVQAERSEDLSVSQMIYLGAGLRPGQESCCSARAASALGLRSNATICCVNGREAGRLSRTQVAILRNPNNRRTGIEVAVAMRDLLPTQALSERYSSDQAGAMQSDMWTEGLQIGFSFALNDGDDSLASEGWLGYYPHAIKTGRSSRVMPIMANVPGETWGEWHDGQREPSKSGVLQLGGEYHAAAPLAPSARFHGGLFSLGLLGGCLAMGWWMVRGMPTWRDTSPTAKSVARGAGAGAFFLSGWCVGIGGGPGSLACGGFTGGLLVLAAQIAWHARHLKQKGSLLTLSSLCWAVASSGQPARGRVDPLASADQSSVSSFTPPTISDVASALPPKVSSTA